MKAQRLTLMTGVVIALALVGIIVYSQFQPEPTAPSAAANGELNYEGQPVLGDAAAPVTIAVFEDFKCPACAFFEESAFPRVERELVDTGAAKVVFFNYPFLGPDSTTAAIASECAFSQSESAFWEYKTILYRSQGPENQRWATPARLTELAETYVPDLDSEALSSCIEERAFEGEVTAEREMGTAAGVQGTPSVFVNGEKVESERVVTFEDIQAAIAETE